VSTSGEGITVTPGRTALAILVGSAVGIGLISAPAEAAPSTPAPTATSAAIATVDPTAPQVVKDEVARLTAEGAEVLQIGHSDYELKNATSDLAAAAYPSGCGLWVVETRSGNVIENSSLTTCVQLADTMEMFGGIGRSRVLGQWQTMKTGESDDYITFSLHLTVKYNCAGTGTHDFQSVTNGALELGGHDYEAAAYDILEKQHC
jgi:hypothetical protein